MKKFFQNSIWFGLAVIYAIGILVSGLLLLYLYEKLSDAGILTENDHLLMGFIIFELLLGLVLMFGFYVKWQRKQAQGDIIYVDRYVNENTQESEIKTKVLDWNNQRAILSEIIKNPNKSQSSNEILKHICNELEAVSGAFYVSHIDTDVRRIELIATYAFALPDSQSLFYEFGEGIAGQVAKVGQKTYLRDIPEGYLNILSGLGESQPSVLLAVPIQQDNTQKDIEENPVKGVIELASFKEFTDSEKEYIDKVADLVAKHL
ncbi:GAF domain-containing protein [Bernardetia sp. ABR2-2B]|uniref:GAF domain-containing protein n=1 Tax=Bernardetia sp. ABR2-2B TaxID=3127472 RepID=UPI0030D11632